MDKLLTTLLIIVLLIGAASGTYKGYDSGFFFSTDDASTLVQEGTYSGDFMYDKYANPDSGVAMYNSDYAQTPEIDTALAYDDMDAGLALYENDFKNNARYSDEDSGLDMYESDYEDNARYIDEFEYDDPEFGYAFYAFDSNNYGEYSDIETGSTWYASDFERNAQEVDGSFGEFLYQNDFEQNGYYDEEFTYDDLGFGYAFYQFEYSRF